MSYIDKNGEDILMYKGNVISIDVSKEDWPKKDDSLLEFRDHTIRKLLDRKIISYNFTVKNK